MDALTYRITGLLTDRLMDRVLLMPNLMFYRREENVLDLK